MSGAGTDEVRNHVITVERKTVGVGVRNLCGVRFVPSPDGVPAEDFVVHRVRHGQAYGRSIRVTEAQYERWSGAERAYLDALSRAYERLARAHGTESSVDLHGGGWSYRLASRPFPWPGWRRRMAERSEAAQREFVARASAATEAYRPVIAEIEAALQRDEAERRAREEAKRREEQRRSAVAAEVAALAVWGCAADDDDPQVLYVYRHDVPPARPVEADGEPMDVRGLERKLKSLRDGRALRRIDWDPAACARVEQDCRDRGAPFPFISWWATVTRSWWNTRPATRGSGASGAVTHVSSHHSSHGVDGSSGGHSCGSHGHGCGGF
ncbi:hypothetical protein ACFPM3_16470 [Streptomyces coeruleoprunus]|uniref:Uncharacterized protein n=1 Tax=Streptomyces coeruleoprunus TaxID=285563 RepID=A0ABV9XHC0_9ACTN